VPVRFIYLHIYISRTTPTHTQQRALEAEADKVVAAPVVEAAEADKVAAAAPLEPAEADKTNNHDDWRNWCGHWAGKCGWPNNQNHMSGDCWHWKNKCNWHVSTKTKTHTGHGPI
jgi:hypothetical protein